MLYLPPIANRQDSTNRSAKEAEVLDILNGIRKLDNTENISVECLTNKLDRIPHCGPEEFDLVTVLDRIMTLEAQYKKQDATITKQHELLHKHSTLIDDNKKLMKNCQSTINQQQVSINSLFRVQGAGGYAKAITNKKVQSHDDDDQIVLSKNYERTNNDKAEKVTTVEPSSVRPRMKRDKLVTVEQLQQALADPEVSEAASKCTEDTEVRTFPTSSEEDIKAPSTEIDNSNFIYPTYFHKQQVRKSKQAVYGKSSNVTGILKSMPRRSDIFVFRLDKETTSDEVKQYIQSKDIPVHSIDRTSREESVFSSFKVSVDSSNISVIMDEEFWPEGIGCRKFIRRRQPPGRLPVNED